MNRQHEIKVECGACANSITVDLELELDSDDVCALCEYHGIALWDEERAEDFAEEKFETYKANYYAERFAEDGLGEVLEELYDALLVRAQRNAVAKGKKKKAWERVARKLQELMNWAKEFGPESNCK